MININKENYKCDNCGEEPVTYPEEWCLWCDLPERSCYK